MPLPKLNLRSAATRMPSKQRLSWSALVGLAAIGAASASGQVIATGTAAAGTASRTPAMVAKPLPPTPVLVELPDNLNGRAEALVEQRREIFAAFKESGGEAEAEVAVLLPNLQLLADEQRLREISPALVPALRRLAYLQSLRHDFGGRRNVTMLASATASPTEGLTFVENAQWTAARLCAAGDNSGMRLLAEYAGFDPTIAVAIAEVLTADPDATAEKTTAIGEKLRANSFDEVAGDEALLILKRGLGAEPERHALQGVLEGLVPACSPRIQAYVRAAAAGDKFSRTEKLVGTTEFKVLGTLVDGKPFDSGTMRGKVIIVDFWATWCGPCVAELPRLVSLNEKHKDDGLVIVGISNDSDREALEGFLKSHPEISWPQLFDTKSAANNEMHELARASGIQGIPALFAIDRQGVLRSVQARSDLESIVVELLGEPAAK